MQQNYEMGQDLIETAGDSTITYHQFGGDTPTATMKGSAFKMQFNETKKTTKLKLNWNLTSVIIVGTISLTMLIATLTLLVKISNDNEIAEEEWDQGVSEMAEYTWNITDSLDELLTELKKEDDDNKTVNFDFSKEISVFNKTFEKLTQRIMTNFGWALAPNGYYYKLVQEKERFDIAEYKCSLLGGNLASKGIRDNTTRLWIYTNLVKPPNQNTWVGLNDMNEEGTYVWSDGVVSTKNNTNWAKGEPNNSGRRGEDCAHFWPAKLPDTLNDAPCSRNSFFLCEAMF